MAQQLRAQAALPDALSSIPNNHRMACNHLQWVLMPSSLVKLCVDKVLIYRK